MPISLRLASSRIHADKALRDAGTAQVSLCRKRAGRVSATPLSTSSKMRESQAKMLANILPLEPRSFNTFILAHPELLDETRIRAVMRRLMDVKARLPDCDILSMVRAEAEAVLLTPLPQLLQQITLVEAVLRKFVRDEVLADILSHEPSMLFMDHTQLELTLKRCFGYQMHHGLGAGVAYLAIDRERICRIYRVIRNKKRWHAPA